MKTHVIETRAHRHAKTIRELSAKSQRRTNCSLRELGVGYMDDFLDSALAQTATATRPVGVDENISRESGLVQRMQRALVEKHQYRLAELMRTVEAHSAELEELSEAFREGGEPPEGWQPQRTPELEEEDESESEEEVEPEAGAELQLHRLLERPRWKL